MTDLTGTGIRANRQTAIETVTGILLCAVLGWLFNSFPPGQTGGISFQPGLAVPALFGFLFGPLVGFLSGLGGGILNALWSGGFLFPPVNQSDNPLIEFLRLSQLHWHIGAGVIGAVSGMVFLMRRRYLSLAELGRALLYALHGVLFGNGLAAGFSVWIDGFSFQHAVDLFARQTGNVLISIVFIVPLALYLNARVDWNDREWMRLHFSRQIIFIILLPVVLFALLSSLLLLWQAEWVIYLRDLRMIMAALLALLLVVCLGCSVYWVQRIAMPLQHMLKVARHFKGVNSDFLSNDLADADEVTLLEKSIKDLSLYMTEREETFERQLEVLQARVAAEMKRSEDQASGKELVDLNFYSDLQSRLDELRRK